MISFKDHFLLEDVEQPETKGKQLKHLRHLEDHVLYDGDDGVARTDHHLNSMHNQLLGKRAPIDSSAKYDGSVSTVFGHHPETGKFFVASKSAFNKNPKINYTNKDIEANHGHAPRLVDKLKASLEHLPKITPSHGIFQGDLMHIEGDAKTNKRSTSITPNTITYSAPKDSAEGRNMNKKLGIVVHTQYKGGKKLENMSASPLDNNTRKSFKEHPDVNNIDPSIKTDPSNYTSKEQNDYLNHMENARKAYSRMKPEAMETLAGHGPALENYINDTVKNSKEPSVEGYKAHITARHEKDLNALKSTLGQDKKIQGHSRAQEYINNNSNHFKSLLELHNHFQKAKDVLTNVLAKNSPYNHSVNGSKVGPEGTVVFDREGNASKLVNRAEFSKNNFLFSAARKRKEEENA